MKIHGLARVEFHFGHLWQCPRSGRLPATIVGAPRDLAVWATLGRSGDVIGIFAFRATQRTNSLRSRGTWVRDCWRRGGLATAMWDRVLRSTRPAAVTVTTVSAQGHTLVAALRERHREIRWREQVRWGYRDLRRRREAA